MRRILGTVSSIFAFAISAADAGRIARELPLEWNALKEKWEPHARHELQHLSQGVCWAKLARCKLRLETPNVTALPAEQAEALTRTVVARSREQFGYAPPEVPPPPVGPAMQPREPNAVPSPLDGLDPGSVF
jgi:hypothetical protein